MIFSSLDLAPEIQKAIDECGYKEMTPIQEKAIIPARRGKDILANAQTGTGKTAAFTLPILQLMQSQSAEYIEGKTISLILTPTRELAEQLAESVNRYAQYLSFSIISLYGGVKVSAQQKKLKNNINIIVSTPGRLLEHLTLGNVDLSHVQFLVLDEADRMLDMGFNEEVTALLQKLPTKRQTFMFSATLSEPVKQLAKSILRNHEVVSVAKQNATADTVEHVVYPVSEQMKSELFVELIDRYNWFKVLVFTSTKSQADELKIKLKEVGIKAGLVHGDKSQGSRRRALADFNDDKMQVLISTEITARGLNIKSLDHVVNYNLPFLAEDYIHRIGRTGRAGNKGEAISFVSREEERNLDNIQRLIGYKIKRINLAGYEVGSRDVLLDTISKTKRALPSNKARQLKNIHKQADKAKSKNKKK
ncbi:MAG: DEAD/DEAH box helicase [Woeseiaceae bacterium]